MNFVFPPKISPIYNLIFTVHNLFLNYGEIIREIKIILVADWSKLKKRESEERKLRHISFLGCPPRRSLPESKKLKQKNYSESEFLTTNGK